MAIFYAVISKHEEDLSRIFTRIFDLSRPWPTKETYVNGKQYSSSPIAEARGRVWLTVHHAGVGVVEESDDTLTVSLTPSRLIGAEELKKSPFASRVELNSQMIKLESGPAGSPPIAYHQSEGLLAASCPPSLLSLQGAHPEVVRPRTIVQVSFEEVRLESGDGERREVESFSLSLREVGELIHEVMLSVVGDSVSRRPAILFSGGLDSALLAWYCLTLGCKPLAVSVGLKGSHDLAASERAAKLIGVEHVAVELSEEETLHSSERLADTLLLQGTMDKALSVVFYEGSRCAVSLGRRQVVSGQGADELFGGYMKYVRLINSVSPVAAEVEMKRDLDMLWLKGLPRDYASSALAGALLTVPYLDERVVNKAYNIPLEFKILRGVRKMILREVARIAGLPEELVAREKKAAQYGSGVERLLKKRGKRL